MRESQYSIREEKLNVQSHALGLILSILALVVLIIKSYPLQKPFVLLSVLVFGFSLIVLYASSTLYHNATNFVTRRKLRIADHAAIFGLIAGTYTPFAVITLQAWTFLIVIWIFAFTGILLKVFFTGRFNHLSTIIYVIMGWSCIFFVKPLLLNLSTTGLLWLLAGGIFYTVGAVFYSITKIPFNHFIFHVFVLLGSFCHFLSVYFLVV